MCAEGDHRYCILLMLFDLLMICRRFLADEVLLSKLLPTDWLPDLSTVLRIWGEVLNPCTVRSLTIRLSASLRTNTSYG